MTVLHPALCRCYWHPATLMNSFPWHRAEGKEALGKGGQIGTQIHTFSPGLQPQLNSSRPRGFAGWKVSGHTGWAGRQAGASLGCMRVPAKRNQGHAKNNAQNTQPSYPGLKKRVEIEGNIEVQGARHGHPSSFQKGQKEICRKPHVSPFFSPSLPRQAVRTRLRSPYFGSGQSL